jgi:hypothetical protein
VAFYVSTGARASELLSTQDGVDPGRQLITVVRKGTRERQELPASVGMKLEDSTDTPSRTRPSISSQVSARITGRRRSWSTREMNAAGSASSAQHTRTTLA